MIYIHIGTSKTGTTSIQRYLMSNRDALLLQNCLYPSNGILNWGHHNIHYELTGKPRFNAQLGSLWQLIEEVKLFKNKKPDSNVIISSETLCGTKPEYLAKIFDGLKVLDDIKVIVYYRRQDQYLRSFWTMYVGQKKIDIGFERWAKMIIEKNKYSLYYDRQVKKFEGLIGSENIILNAYDDINKDEFVEYFLNICGVHSNPSFKEMNIDYNKSSLHKKFNENEVIKNLCKKKYAASNRKLALNYLNRGELFNFL